MKKRRPAQFSIVKAVKRNSRSRVGTPPPERVLEDAKARTARRATRHQPTLAKLLREHAD